MINCIHIKKFKSIRDAKVNLSSFVAIVGKNAAGKTNFVQAINLIKELALGKTVTAIQRKITFVPYELFNYSERDKEFLISIEFKTKDGKEYCLEIVIVLENDKAPLKLNIKHERLERIVDNKEKQIIYERTPGKLIDGNKKDIPLSVDQDRLVLSLYNNSETIVARKEIINIIVPKIDTVNAKDSIGTIGINEENLASVLLDLRHGDKKSYESFQKIIKELIPSVASFVEIPIPISGNDNSSQEKKDVILFLQERNLSERLSMECISEGDFRALFIIASAVKASTGSSLIIEEVENGMHPQRALDIIDHLRTIAIKKDIQIIFTTHSAEVINNLSAPEVLYVEKDQERGTIFISLKDAGEIVNVDAVLRKGGKITDILENI